MTLQTFVVSCCSALHHSLTAVLSMRPVRFLNIPFKMDAHAHTHRGPHKVSQNLVTSCFTALAKTLSKS